MSKDKLEIVTLRLFQGDKEALQEFYPNAGHNKVIRTLVRQHVLALRKRVSSRIPEEEMKYEG